MILCSIVTTLGGTPPNKIALLHANFQRYKSQRATVSLRARTHSAQLLQKLSSPLGRSISWPHPK